jgi:hypothetical protein
LKYIGFDQIIESVIERLGDVERVYVSGDFAQGKDSNLIDLVFIGNIDKVYLQALIEKTETFIKRKIRSLVYASHELNTEEVQNIARQSLLLWSTGK